MKKSDFFFTCARIINDGVMVFLGLVLAWFLRMQWFMILGLGAPTTLVSLELFYVFAFKITAVLMIVLALNGRYRFGTDEKIWDEILHIFWAFSAGMALILVGFFFSQFTFFSRFIFGVAWILSLSLMLGGRMGLRWLRTEVHKLGYGRTHILLLGTGNVARQAVAWLDQSPEFAVTGVLSEKKPAAKTFQGHTLLGSIAQFESLLKKHSVDEVLLATDQSSENITAKLVRIAHTHHVKFRYLPDELGLDLAAVEVSTLGNLPLITLQNTKLGGWGYVLKSTFDYIIALIATLLLSPVLVVVSILVKREEPNAPLLYRSVRVGRNGKTFHCLKFRTMVADAEAQKAKLLKKNQRKGGVLFKLDNDPRITPLGHTLRQWSLDELPQLLNVLRGEMSLIGPRPHLPEEVEKYGQNDRRVLSIKPGITGFAQINGRSSLSFAEEMNYELFYLKNWSLWLDAIIFIKSVWIVLRREHAS